MRPLTPLLLAAALHLALPAHADWVLPPGSAADLAGGTASMGCVSVLDSGALRLGDGALLAAQDVTVYAGAQLVIGRGRVELARQWSNQGNASATTGGVTRAASPGCPVAGLAGAVPLRDTAIPVPATSAAMLGLLAAALALLAGRRLRPA